VTGKTSLEPLTVTVGTNNHLVAFGYDAAGDMVNNGTVSYTYDAENRLIWTNGLGPTPTRYIYDGDGNRVEKCQASTSTTACPTSGTTGTLYWRGTSSDPHAETDLAGNVLESYIFFGEQRIARRDAVTKAVHFYFSDRLGSHGVVTNATGTACEQDIDYYPYGGSQKDYCTTPVAQNYKFTGKERDSESGSDNFEFRYYSSSLGRFLKPDEPFLWNESNPQGLNLYGYVNNNPLSRIDPDGRDCIYVDNDTGQLTGWNRGDCDNSTEEKANSGNYVDGKVDWSSMRYDQASESLNFSYTDENGNAGTVSVLGVSPRSFSDQISGSWQSFKDRWEQRIDAHRPPPQKPTGLEPLQDINDMMMGWVPVASSGIKYVTRSGSITNIETDLTPQEFGKNLEESGFTKSTSKDGSVTNYVKGARKYSVYSKSASTGGPSAQVFENGQTIAKIRLR